MAAEAAIVAAGVVMSGRMMGSRHTIPTIGALRRFSATERNEAIFVKYTRERIKELGLG
jgi:uncharacterized protein